jgi:cell division protein FtsX
MDEDDLIKSVTDMDSRLKCLLTRLSWTVNLWGSTITILLGIAVFLVGTPIRGHGQ